MSDSGSEVSASLSGGNETSLNPLPLQIYFCGSIRGGRQDNSLYTQIVHMLQSYGHVLTECIIANDPDATIIQQCDGKNCFQSLTKDKPKPAWSDQDKNLSLEQTIFQIDMDWLKAADVLVAEVTQPSLGVGFELGAAWRWNKPVLCLFRPSSGKHLSALVEGADTFTILRYETIGEVEENFREFLQSHNFLPTIGVRV